MGKPFTVNINRFDPYKSYRFLVYFGLDGTPVCGRVDPNAGAKDGAPMRLAMDLNNMHLLNEATGVVL